MSESSGEKTEQPTAERLRRARKEGKVPQSQELPSALMIGALALVLSISAGNVLEFLTGTMVSSMTEPAQGRWDPQGAREIIHTAGKGLLTCLVPFLIAGMVISFFSSLLSSGWAFSPKAIRVKLENVNPVSGIKRLISWKSLVRLAMSIIKLVVVGTMVWLYLRGRMGELLDLRYATVAGTLATTSRMVLGVLIRIAGALLVVALVDVLYQRWSYKRGLKMSRQEVKEEAKQYELAPEVKSRIRSIQMQAAQKRMLNDVPEADVVVTNPTHYAVALKYDNASMDAPEVVAKGADLIALKIREIAEEHKVPIIEKPPLARALYGGCEVGQAVPENLFVAVAEVLALVYRMQEKKRRSRV